MEKAMIPAKRNHAGFQDAATSGGSALRRALSMPALAVAVVALGACAAETPPPGPTSTGPVLKGDVYLDDGICFERNFKGRPVRVAPSRCSHLLK